MKTVTVHGDEFSGSQSSAGAPSPQKKNSVVKRDQARADDAVTQTPKGMKHGGESACIEVINRPRD